MAGVIFHKIFAVEIGIVMAETATMSQVDVAMKMMILNVQKPMAFFLTQNIAQNIGNAIMTSQHITPATKKMDNNCCIVLRMYNATGLNELNVMIGKSVMIIGKIVIQITSQLLNHQFVKEFLVITEMVSTPKEIVPNAFADVWEEPITKLVALLDSLSIPQLNNVIGLQTSTDANRRDQA